MAARKNVLTPHFVALDSAVAAQGEQIDAFLMRRLADNLNEIASEALQPAVSTAHEVADPYTSDYPTSEHTQRVNAPYGAWAELVPAGLYRVPPGCRQVQVHVRGEMTSGETALLFCATEQQPFRSTLASGDTGIVAITGTGAAATYPTSGTVTAPVHPGAEGLVLLAVMAQTSEFTTTYRGTLGDVRGDGFEDSAGSTAFGRPTSSPAENLRDDWYYKIFEREALGAAVIEDASGGPGYTDRTSEFNESAAVNDCFPATPAVDDAVYFGHLSRPFDAIVIDTETPAVWTHTGQWQYYNGSSWVACTEIVFEIYDWTNVKGVYLVHWVPPTNMTLTTVNSTAAYWVRYKVTAFTATTTTAQIRQAWVARERMPFSRVLRGDNDGGRVIEPANKERLVTAGCQPNSDFYVVGRANFIEVHAVTVLPVASPDIT